MDIKIEGLPAGWKAVGFRPMQKWDWYLSKPGCVQQYKSDYASTTSQSYLIVERHVEYVQLEQCDIKPGAVVRRPRDPNRWYSTSSPDVKSLVLTQVGSPMLLYYEDMFKDGSEISFDFGKTWQLCRKEKVQA